MGVEIEEGRRAPQGGAEQDLGDLSPGNAGEGAQAVVGFRLRRRPPEMAQATHRGA